MLTDFQNKLVSPLIAYWKFWYEPENYGRFIYDYSNNGNIPLDVSSTTYFSDWTTLTNLVLCTST